jgi:tRNA nucleotidyltransferase (CCA-adding enzyme)
VWRGDIVDGWPDIVDQVRSRGEATSRAQLAISGDDLIKAGMTPGPQIGQTLERLLSAVLDEPTLNERDRLLALATFSL